MMYTTNNSQAVSFRAANADAHNVECFLPIQYITESAAENAAPAQGNPAAEWLLSLLAEILLLLRAPLARFIRFFAVLGLSALFLVLIANAAVSGQITLFGTVLRVGAVVLFAVLGTRRCA